jgi:hypothetical protein
MRASHRHPARVSATLLPKDSSLFDAMRAINRLGTSVEIGGAQGNAFVSGDLLKELDDRLGSDQPDGTTHSKRPANC